MNRRHRKHIAALLLTTVCAATGPARADSLWQRRNPQRAFLTQDSRARNVGDLMTVIIGESSEVQNSEDNALSKQSGNGVSGEIEATSAGGFPDQSSSASLDATNSARRSFSGRASYRDSREYSDHITVSVVDVLPNGNMVIAGRRNLTIAGEHRTLVISGMVRPIDLGPDNKVQSRYVADLRTVYEGDGPSRRFSRQGWFSKAANKVWPF